LTAHDPSELYIAFSESLQLHETVSLFEVLFATKKKKKGNMSILCIQSLNKTEAPHIVKNLQYFFWGFSGNLH
jgi:hypothetical protein